MQKRHTNRFQYFHELAHTSERYFIPYIKNFLDLGRPISVLEVGCGDGGNLLPFARGGHEVMGVDISDNRVKGAISFFERESAEATFICDDILNLKAHEGYFDLIICHDVIEHIHNKLTLLLRIESLLKPKGIVFVGFPAWQMPFGGHQQICRNKLISIMPFIHLLPQGFYRCILSLGNESDECINELLSIRQTNITVEKFEKLAAETSLEIVNRRLYLINPHYEVKFGLKPRRLPEILSKIPYFRDYLSTSCFYLLRHK